MPRNIKMLLAGILCALVVGISIFEFFGPKVTSPLTEPAPITNIPPDTVVIDRLPVYRTLNGINVAFDGKANHPQTITGRWAKNVIIKSFRATGENAHKSSIKITWEDGSVESIAPGIANKQLPPEKRAKEIVVTGYSVRERKIFRDDGRPGVLNWEIFYEPVE